MDWFLYDRDLRREKINFKSANLTSFTFRPDFLHHLFNSFIDTAKSTLSDMAEYRPIASVFTNLCF